MTEKRREGRSQIELAVRLKVGKKSLVGHTLDLAFKGLGVSVSESVPMRQLVQLEIDLPSGSTLRGHAMVVHSSDSRVGLEFFGSGLGSDWDAFVQSFARASAPPPPRTAAAGTSPMVSIPPAPAGPSMPAELRDAPPPKEPRAAGGITGPQTGPRGIERRLAPRIPLRLELRLRTTRGIFTGYTTEVSMLSAGVLVHACDAQFSEPVILNLIQPNTSFSFRRDGIVKRVTPIQDGWCHLGVEFAALEPMREVLFADFMNTAYATLSST